MRGCYGIVALVVVGRGMGGGEEERILDGVASLIPDTGGLDTLVGIEDLDWIGL